MKKIILILLILFVSFSFSFGDSSNYIFESTMENNTKIYEVYLDDGLSSNFEFRELLLVLKYALKDDKFIFNINYSGGDAFTAIQICNALRNTKATTTAYIIKAFSAGAFIALSCDHIIINDFSIMMIHPIQVSNLYGEVNEIERYVKLIKEINDKIVDIYFKNFLTAKEIKKVKNGETLWLNSNSLRKKLRKH